MIDTLRALTGYWKLSKKSYTLTKSHIPWVIELVSPVTDLSYAFKIGLYLMFYMYSHSLWSHNDDLLILHSHTLPHIYITHISYIYHTHTYTNIYTRHIPYIYRTYTNIYIHLTYIHLTYTNIYTRQANIYTLNIYKHRQTYKYT